MANRFAHLHFLRSAGVDAWLILVNFVGDAEMGGPETAREWQAAYGVAWRDMGPGKRHSLARYMIEVYPDVREQHARYRPT